MRCSICSKPIQERGKNRCRCPMDEPATVLRVPRLGDCTLIKDHGMGTIDVKRHKDGKHYRISGLPMVTTG